MLELNIEYGPIGYTHELPITRNLANLRLSIGDAIDKSKTDLLAQLALIKEHLPYVSADPTPTKIYWYWCGEMARGTSSIDMPTDKDIDFIANEALEFLTNQTKEYFWRWEDGFKVLGHHYGITCGVVRATDPDEAERLALAEQEKTTLSVLGSIGLTPATLTIKEI